MSVLSNYASRFSCKLLEIENVSHVLVLFVYTCVALTISEQPFSFLVVLDFESTCWQDGKFRTQEISKYL